MAKGKREKVIRFTFDVSLFTFATVTIDMFLRVTKSLLLLKISGM